MPVHLGQMQVWTRADISDGISIGKHFRHPQCFRPCKFEWEKKKHGYIFFIFEVIPLRRFLLTLRCFQVRNNVPHPVFLIFSSGLCWLLWIIHFLPLLYCTLEAMPPLEFSSPFTLLFKVAGDECWSTLVCCFADIIPLKLKCLIIIFCHWKWHLQNMIHLLALSMMSLLMERNNVYFF